MSDPADIQGTDILLTVFLKHDQSKPLEEFQAILDARRWWQNFPPEGVETVSWNVVMGIGQIVTLRLPPNKLQAVNVALERYAWGVFRTETFISYDFMGVRDRLARESAARSVDGDTPAVSGVQPPGGEVPSGAGGSHHTRLPHNGLNLEANQSRPAPPTAYEIRLGDALEAAFAAGHHELPALVGALNAEGVTDPDGATWTEASFQTVMARLGGPIGGPAQPGEH